MVRAGIKALDKLDVAEGVRQQKKEEAQMLAEALLDAEVKIGEILARMPKASGKHWEDKRESKSSTAGTFNSLIETKQQAAEKLGNLNLLSRYLRKLNIKSDTAVSFDFTADILRRKAPIKARHASKIKKPTQYAPALLSSLIFDFYSFAISSTSVVTLICPPSYSDRIRSEVLTCESAYCPSFS
jgi:hypothetical protein